MDGAPETIATMEDGPETSFCLAGNDVRNAPASWNEDCRCRRCRQSKESIASDASTEDGRSSTRHDSYAKRWPLLERKRRKSVNKYKKGNTALNDINHALNDLHFAASQVSDGLRSLVERVHLPMLGNQPDPPALDETMPASRAETAEKVVLRF